MIGWLRRWLSGEPAAPVAPAAPRQTAASAPASPGAVPTGFGLQRPLVGAQGRVAGFEFSLPPALARRLAAREGQQADPAARAAHSALLMGVMRPVLAQGRRAVAELSADMLQRPIVLAQIAEGAWLCVPDLAALPADAAAALRARGVRLGVPDGPPAGAPAADFVWLRAQGDDLDTLLLSAQRWQEARPRLPLICTGLGAVEDIEELLRSGFSLAGGQLDRRRQASTKPLNAAAHRICELLNHLALNRDTSTVADAVRADVALSYRLLRYANSPALGMSRGIESVEQAVLLLGRQELSRWLQMLLLTSSASRQAAAALQEQALARGRLLELLARADGETAPEALFSVGLFSMLEAILETPLAEALAPLNMSAPASQALLQGQGPWAAHLQLAMALDSADPAQAATAEAIAARWGGIDEVQSLAEAAWAWAASLGTADTAGSKKPVV